jgi:hypothetical protein
MMSPRTRIARQCMMMQRRSLLVSGDPRIEAYDARDNRLCLVLFVFYQS